LAITQMNHEYDLCEELWLGRRAAGALGS
jgi:hypothetical protein